MKREEFVSFVDRMVEDFGVRSWLDNGGEGEDDPWFECPVCGEPILFEDWADDELLENEFCPICETNFYDEDELWEDEDYDE